MREINTSAVYSAVKRMAQHCVCSVDKGILELLSNAEKTETSPNAKFALQTILKSDAIAMRKNIPACQDTGMAVIFLEIGQSVLLTGDLLADAVNNAVRDAYEEHFFRKSVLDPLNRANTKTNTPAVIHTEIVSGDKVTVSFLAKGFGSENMSKIFMLTPSQGLEGVISSVLETVKSAGSNPCPPIVVGVGIGGTFEKAAIMSKKCLLRDANFSNPDIELDNLEKLLLQKINQLGIGAQGFGGTNTALAVFCDKYPTHLAGLPVAVNIQCHSVRHMTVTL